MDGRYPKVSQVSECVYMDYCKHEIRNEKKKNPNLCCYEVTVSVFNILSHRIFPNGFAPIFTRREGVGGGGRKPLAKNTGKVSATYTRTISEPFLPVYLLLNK